MKLVVDLAIVFIIVCASASLIAGSAHFLGRGLIAQLAPGARARLRLALLFAPLAAGVFAVSAALLPSLLHVAGIAEDHCLAPAAHGHAHIAVEKRLDDPAEGGGVAIRVGPHREHEAHEGERHEEGALHHRCSFHGNLS